MRTHKVAIAKKIARKIEDIIKLIGENHQREGLIKTPHRAAKAILDLTDGYHTDIDQVINNAFFHADNDAMVVVKGIEFHSLCEHHMLPFHGQVHVGYLPQKTVIGLSKIPRIVDVFAHRLQIQEKLSMDIAKCLESYLNPLGVGVIIEAKHSCLCMRGIEKQNSSMLSSALLGSFRDCSITRHEFMQLIQLNSASK